MRVVEINTVYGVGSTGKIVKQLQSCARERGHDVIVAHRYGEQEKDRVVAVSSWLDCHVHNRLAVSTGLQGCFSTLRTHAFLRYLRHFSPDLLHLHNIHGSFINHRLLISFVKKHSIPVVWTLHDCWAFTGGCTHFEQYSCPKWKDGCFDCPYIKGNKKTLFDVSSFVWKKKKKWFEKLDQAVLVCPSHWLKNLVGQSFLREHPCMVIHNGIDLAVFSPKESHFREQHRLKNKIIVLGVAFGWGARKGLDVFVELAKRLDEQYQIILVGTDDKVDEHLPPNIISIHRTQNQQELAEIYSAADVFVNPTREENYPTVNMEALACGTPVVTFRTGGSPEMLDDTCGSVVPCDDVDALEKEIIRVCKEKPYSKEQCVRKAQEFDQSKRFKEYVELYEKISDARREER